PVDLRKRFGLEMRRGQNAAIGAIAQRLMIMSILAGKNGETFRTPAQQIERLIAVRATVLQSDYVRMRGQSQHRVVAEIDAGPVGNVVERNRMRGAIRERAEVKLQAALRWPRIIRAGNQITVDRPRRICLQRLR